ncbi:hypothetical protein [Chitinophaga lutea]
MTISLFQLQIQRLLHCNATIYIRHTLAGAFHTLRDAGLQEEEMVEHPIDETLSLREFEEELEEKFNFSLELCNQDAKPFTNKSMRLFQISRCAGTPDVSLDIPLELLSRPRPDGLHNRAV